MGAVDIPVVSLLICFLLLGFSIYTSIFLKLKLIKNIAISVTRMSVQLILVGVFLTYIFDLNNVFINISWVILMISMAVYTTLKSSELKWYKIIFPAFLSFLVSTFFVILYINFFVVRIKNIFDAKYLIVLSGMLLGNTLRGNIIGINHFYSNIKKEQKQYFYILSLGATDFEAQLPYIQQSMKDSLKPTLATMATMGIVALPGMMTGNMLGGTSPIIAIKYQIMIMIAIFVCTNLSVLFTILTTIRISFDSYGVLKSDIFIK